MNIKRAKTTHAIHELLQERWSPRAFSQKNIEKEKLQRLFEAARWAPSSSNEQPWRFVIGIKGDDTYERIFSTLVEFNQLWAITAPVLVLMVAKNTSNKNPDKPNLSAHYDLGQAVSYLTFQAMADGLFVHQMGGLDTHLADKLFEVPKGFHVVTAAAIGYLGNAEMLHPNFQKMEVAERERIALSDMVFDSSFGNTSQIVMEEV